MDKICFTPFPNLSTERLTLRQLINEDENEIFKLRSDQRVNKYLTRPDCKTVEEARKFINNINSAICKDESIYWAITLKNDNLPTGQAGKLIGTICLWNILKEHFRAEIGFELLPDFQGKGIMQEALTIVLDYGFKNMKLHSIAGQVSPDNLPSIRLMERNNFIREAYFKEDFYYNGKFLDTAVYSLLNRSQA